MIQGTLTNLRSVDRSDLDRIHAWFDDPDLMRFWGYGASATSRTNTIARIEDWLATESQLGHPVAFVIETLNGDPCGLLVLSDVQPIDRSTELSLFLEPPYRDQGIGADVLETIADAAFAQWNFHRLTARSEQHNTRAHGFFRRNGFALEGRLREARFLDGAWHDILVFGRLAPKRMRKPHE